MGVTNENAKLVFVSFNSLLCWCWAGLFIRYRIKKEALFILKPVNFSGKTKLYIATCRSMECPADKVTGTLAEVVQRSDRREIYSLFVVAVLAFFNAFAFAVTFAFAGAITFALADAITGEGASFPVAFPIAFAGVFAGVLAFVSVVVTGVFTGAVEVAFTGLFAGILAGVLAGASGAKGAVASAVAVIGAVLVLYSLYLLKKECQESLKALYWPMPLNKPRKG